MVRLRNRKLDDVRVTFKAVSVLSMSECLHCLITSDSLSLCAGPRWASWNLGVFMCIRCAGIHRNLGVHISRVKSVNLDSWTPEQIEVFSLTVGRIALQ